MIIRMIVFVLVLSLSFLYWADLSDVSKGLDIQEKIHFSSADQCQETVTTALNNTGYTVEKAEEYKQGPTIWGVSEGRTNKSMTKCMLRYDLVITFVIGQKDNLKAAVDLNKEIQRVVAGGTKHIWQPQSKGKGDGETTEEENFCEGNFTQWGDFTRFSFVRKIETGRIDGLQDFC